MPTWLTVDTNFYDGFANWPSEADRRSILLCRDRGSIEFFLSLESLEESAALYYDEEQLRTRAETILQFLRDRVLARPEDIVKSELRGQTQLLESDEAVGAVRAVFQQVLDGHIPSSLKGIAERASKMKLDTAHYYEGFQGKLRSDVPKAIRGDLSKTSYADFHARYWGRHGKSYVARLAAVHGIADAEDVAQRVLVRPDEFPFTTTLMTVLSRLLHRYLLANRRIDEGDAYDVRQLIYLAGLDVLVTDDRKVREMFGEIHNPPKEVKTLASFIAE